MKRRDFLKVAGMSGLAAVLPPWMPRAFAARSVELPVPPLLEPDAGGHVALTLQSGRTAFGPISAATWLQRRSAREKRSSGTAMY